MTSRMALTAALMAAVTMGGASQAQAAVSVFSNGLASFCSHFARDGRDDNAALETCNLSLETEAMNRDDRAGTLVNRGIIKLRRKSYRDARADFDAALRLEPEMGEAWVNRGASFVAERRYAEALPEIDKGLSLGADEPEKAYYNRALAHEGLDDLKAAYLDYLKALELKPDWEMPATDLKRFTVSRR